MTDDAYRQLMKHAHRLAMDGHGELAQFLRDAMNDAQRYSWLRADAERYRWLRGGPDVPPESNRWARWEVRHWCGRWWNTLFAEALDAAIDAAMKGTT